MVHEEDLLRERIHTLIHRENISRREFAIKVGKPVSNIYEILSGKRGIPKGLSTDIFTAFPQVNKDWLLFGEGSMYEGDGSVNELPKDTRPRLPRVLSEGHLVDYFEGEKRSLCQEKPIIKQFPDYDFSLFLKTDRMSPNYRRGDELFFKKTSIKEWGGCFLLDTIEGPKFKKVYEDEDEKGNPAYRCVAYNREEYPDFKIPKDFVYAFYKCVGVLRIL